jgi:LmbE family N-acetylglucosaminyl deacetylase
MSLSLRSLRSLGLARILCATLLPAATLAGGATPARAADDSQRIQLVWKTDGEHDRIRIDELDLAPGEARSFASESGRQITVTRDADGDGYEVDIEGRKLRLLEGGARTMRLRDGEDGEPTRRIRRIETLEANGAGKRKILVAGGEPRVLLFEGEPGEEGFAFRLGPGGHPALWEHLLARIERTDRYQALDDTTREIVREVVREAAPGHEWTEREDGDRFEVRIERRRARDGD